MSARAPESRPYPFPLGSAKGIRQRRSPRLATFVQKEGCETQDALASFALSEKLTLEWENPRLRARRDNVQVLVVLQGVQNVQDVHVVAQLLQASDFLFGDDFESGDLSAWSLTVP